MTLISLPPLPGPDTALPPDSAGIVANDGFLPDIDLGALRAAMRITGSVPAERLRAAVIAAIVTVDIDLASWAGNMRSAGHERLADIPARSIDGQSVLVHLYLRAVALNAKAELIERMPDFDTTAAGGKDMDQQGESVSDLRRDAIHAVRDIRGRLRTMVDLI